MRYTTFKEWAIETKKIHFNEAISQTQKTIISIIENSMSMPAIDSEEYPPIPGLEGPFRFKNGRVLYYDPSYLGGSYYDSKTDIYIDKNELSSYM